MGLSWLVFGVFFKARRGSLFVMYFVDWVHFFHINLVVVVAAAAAAGLMTAAAACCCLLLLLLVG